jgi:hypothetical protein
MARPRKRADHADQSYVLPERQPGGPGAAVSADEGREAVGRMPDHLGDTAGMVCPPIQSPTRLCNRMRGLQVAKVQTPWKGLGANPVSGVCL